MEIDAASGHSTSHFRSIAWPGGDRGRCPAQRATGDSDLARRPGLSRSTSTRARRGTARGRPRGRWSHCRCAHSGRGGCRPFCRECSARRWPAEQAVGLGAAWTSVERAVLADPTYAASYAALVQRGSGEAAQRWISLSPSSPGKTDAHMAWFFVSLPQNLLAIELVSEGSHATYLFRAGGSARRPSPSCPRR